MSGEEGKVFGEYSIQHVVNFSSVILLMLLMCPRSRLSRISRYVDGQFLVHPSLTLNLHE